MALLRLFILSISSPCNLDIEANKFYDRTHRLYEAALHTDVTLNMLFGHIKTPKVVILDILSEFNLSTR